MKQELSIAISTCDDRVFGALELIANANYDVTYLLLHQSVGDSEQDRIQDRIAQLPNKNIRYVNCNSRGVTHTRNLAIELCKTPYLMFTDDDVWFTEELNKALQLLRDSDYAAATYVCLNERNQPRKNYSQYAHRHTRLSILKTGVEIIIDVAKTRASYALYPINMGAGAPLPACDEAVFLHRIMTGGATVGFFPLAIVCHKDESAGSSLLSSGELMARGVLFKEVFGYVAGTVLLALFLLKAKKSAKLRPGVTGLLTTFVDAYRGFFTQRAR